MWWIIGLTIFVLLWVTGGLELILEVLGAIAESMGDD